MLLAFAAALALSAPAGAAAPKPPNVLFCIADEGALTYVEEQGTGGRTPRHFGLEPAAKHLAIANEGSDTVLASRIDATNGRLKPSGIFASAPSPVCVKFLSPSEPAP